MTVASPSSLALGCGFAWVGHPRFLCSRSRRWRLPSAHDLLAHALARAGPNVGPEVCANRERMQAMGLHRRVRDWFTQQTASARSGTWMQRMTGWRCHKAVHGLSVRVLMQPSTGRRRVALGAVVRCSLVQCSGVWG